MEANSPITKPEIQTELVGRQNSLESQVDHLDRFIQDLVSHKLSLENANRQIEQLAQAETDPTKRGKYYTTLRINIELLTKIFDSIAKLETIKHNYHKEIDDVIVNKIKLIAIDIRRLDEMKTNGGEDLVGFFEKLGNAMANIGKDKDKIGSVSNKVETEMANSPEYKL
jgi:DNA repair ATPase RecN